MVKPLYTVEEVAKMTGLTSRTIHNYIRDGKIKGKKIGVQWRFTEENIEALFSDADAKKDVTDAQNQAVLEFLEQTGSPTETEMCTVMDVSASDQTAIEPLAQDMLAFVNAHQETGVRNFSYQYIEKRQTARFIVIGEIEKVQTLISMTREHERKNE
ncbi:helix-turn-helix domain-containing protein [Bacillus massiliglaciei]|uniref:helix-turn-helix domain-containing protein n=1 Tax=Bacillus massiliglaciei TaxID=1816693 RepID=UPI0018FE192C|nr:helix-turn-helix domain-containing protein [Bacillus massiliglaciei]